MEILDASPRVDVQTAEYVRLLGYPRGWVLEGRAAELAAWARAWYQEHGRPWTFVRHADRVEIAEHGVVIEGERFSGPRLTGSMAGALADGAVLAAASAGPEAEDEAQRLWRAERPDEYFFLETYASAVVEHLITVAGARLCAWADARGVAILPHASPGYPGWDITEQARLLGLLRRGAGADLPGPLGVLPSGALTPKKSILAVFGVTPHVERVSPLSGLVPCETCSMPACQYRRVPYRRATAGGTRDGAVRSGDRSEPRPPAAAYRVHARALRRWADERLSLEVEPDGTVHARFRYDGTTCTNMGRPLTFHYDVTLGPRAAGHPLRELRCAPAPGDRGHAAMCEYLRDGERLLAAIRDERPLEGQPLEAVFAWRRPCSAAGCYCDASSREHKWGLVLETIHYALSRLEPAEAVAPDDGNPAEAGERVR